MKIAIVFVGALEDGGFNQCALDGARTAGAVCAAEIEIVSGIPYDPDAMTAALRDAASRSDGCVFIGGQGNTVTPAVASAFPDRAFAVVQGNVTGSNLASYDVLQEQPAFLAGALAALVSETGVVGHLSGHRVVPGLKGRAAFAAGIRHVDPGIRLVTGFCGTQDDGDITEAWARGIAREGADVLFTMLNAARDGATRACRKAGVRQIGNVTDWCRTDPETFIASAVARIDMGVIRAVSDIVAGTRPENVLHLGLAENAAALTCAPDVPERIRDHIGNLAVEVATERLPVATTYDGPEFGLGA